MGELNPVTGYGDVIKDVSINIADLDNAMIEHPSMFVHYAYLTVKARVIYDQSKNSSEIRQAQLSAKYRAQFLADGVKATEGLIESSVKMDAEYNEVQTAMIKAQGAWRMAEVAESAFVQRKDMILELARDRRKEREGALRVMEGNAGRESVLKGLKAVNGNGS
jgi:hypothetical protein